MSCLAKSAKGGNIPARLFLTASCLVPSASATFAQQGISPATELPPLSVTQAPPRVVRAPVEIERPAPVAPRPTRRKKRVAARPVAPAPGPAPVAEPVVATPGRAPSPSDITVSATTKPELVQTVGSSVTVITSREIEAEQRRTLPDALTAVPGLNVVQSGGPGGQTSVFIRGTNSNHVKVFIDGIDAGDPSNPNGAFDFGQLLTYDIDRIEVLRGPQSGLYGSDAIGGVISVFTKQGSGPPKVTARVEGGSFGTFNQAASLSGGTPTYDYSFNVSHYKATNIPVTPPELLAPGEKANGNKYDNTSLSAKIGFEPIDTVRINAVARYLDSHLFFTGQDFTVSPSIPNAQQSLQYNQQLFARSEAIWKPFGDLFVQRVGASRTEVHTNTKDPDTIFGPTLANINVGTRDKLDYQATLNLWGQQLIGGLETQTDRLLIEPNTGKQNGNSAGYLQFVGNLYDRAFLAANVRHDDNQAFGGHDTFRVAPSVRLPFTDTIIKASYGTGFKAPTLNQLYVDFPSFGFFANPRLRPEESRGYDLGFEQPLPGNFFRFGATYYQNNIRNLINTSPDGTTLVNVGHAKTYGAESFASWQIVPEFKLRADYTLTIASDEDAHQELIRRPRNKASMQAVFTPLQFPGLTLTTTVIAIGRFIDANRDFSIPRLVNHGHVTVNSAGSYDINPNVQVFARVDNLFDLRYQDPTGFLQPGRGAYGGLRVTY
ncbi:MAG: TonB-dependent receptor [Methylobacteriaceae bacterium]|nr:TonB-dependent receptor [Methylobacteriaceae bacterium]